MNDKNKGTYLLKSLFIAFLFFLVGKSGNAQHLKTPFHFIKQVKIDESQTFVSDIQSLSVDSAGYYYMVSWNDGRMYKYSPHGHLVDVLAHSGRGPGELIYPQTILLAKQGGLIVADALGRISKYTMKGKPTGAFISTQNNRPISDIGSLTNSDILVGGRNDRGGDTIFCFDTKGDYKKISFCEALKIYHNDNYNGYAGTYFAVDKNNLIYTIQSLDYHINVFNIKGKKIKQFGQPHGEYREAIPFKKDLDNSRGREKLEKSFTYYMDIWVDQGRVIVLSRNYVGENNNTRYYVDIYDKKTEKVLLSGLKSDTLELEDVSNGKFYFLRKHYTDNSDIQRYIEVYKYESLK